MDFVISDVAVGALAKLFADGDEIGQVTASSSEVVITSSNLSAMGDGTYAITATQTVDGEESDASPEILVTLDQTAPGAGEGA